MKLLLFLFYNFFIITNSFLNINFGNKFKISVNEISVNIPYKIPLLKKNIINNIEGFYGLIGPDHLSNNETNDLFELFNKNGIIQGIFFSKGTIHFIRKYVKTDKLIYEEQNGEIPMNYLNFFFFELLKNFNLLPNIFGLANTALLNYNNKLYALNERDLPYELSINFNNKTIDTIKRLKIPNMYNFLAHCKIKNNFLETLDYSTFDSKIKFCKFDKNFKLINQVNINKIYTSMIHDFITLEKYLIFIDTPMIIDYKLIFNSTLPLSFNKDLVSKLFIIDKNNGNRTIINLENNTFLFHYANSYEDDNKIVIYACLYDDFDFKTPKLNCGKFRKIIINKNNFDIKIEKNLELEKYSLDFPIVFKNYTILTNSKNLENKNFIIVKNFKLYKIIDFNKNINGEPSIIEIDNKPYIICFAYKKNINYLCIHGIEDNYHLSVKIPHNVSLGFHSIFIKS